MAVPRARTRGRKRWRTRRLREGARGGTRKTRQPRAISLQPYSIYVYSMYISVTRVSLTWSSWRVNYKVEPTIPSLAKRNRWIQLAWVGARRILVCIRSNRSPGPRTMRLHATWMDGKKIRFVGTLWLICFRPSAFITRNPTVPALITIQGFICETC